MEDITNPLYADVLRQKAEEILNSRNVKFDPQRIEGETLKLIHELDVHQIELEMQNEELVLAKKKIEIDAEKYANLYDFAPSGYLTLSKEGEILELNFRSAELLGKERSLLIKNRFGFFVSDETRNIFNVFIDTLLKSKAKETCEITLNVNPEAPTYVYLTGKTSFDEEQCLITMVDITRRKKAEEETKASEEKYRNLFDSNRDSITLFKVGADGKPGNFLIVNKATTHLFGYTNEEFLSLSVKDLEHLTEKKRKIRMESLLSQGKIDFETIIKTKKGNKRNVEVKSILINYENEPAVMNITRDVTERIQNEQNAKKVLENLATILQAIPDILFEVGQDGMIYHYQSHDKDLPDAPAEMFVGKLFQEVLPPEVAEICFAAIQEATEKGRSTGKQYSLEIAKEKKWYELSVSPIKESNDNDKRFIFIAHDITETKSSQEALRESEEKYRNLIENSPNGIIIYLDEKIIFINDEGLRIAGAKSKEEIMEKCVLDFIHPDSNDSIIQRMKKNY